VQIGLPFRIRPSHVKEEGFPGDPSSVAKLLAEKKATAVHGQSRNGWILGADTMVVLGTVILGKPADPNEARNMLCHLSGKTHDVVTGFCLLDPLGKKVHSEAVTTQVKVRPLTEEEIGAYVATGEPFGKAGGYAIQGVGAFMVEALSGSYTNVVGLPVCEVVEFLIKEGVLTFD